MNGPDVVAVTGLSTFFGKRLAQRLAASGRRVVGLDRKRPHALDPGVDFRRIDLTNPTAASAIAEILEKEHVDAVLHTAFRREPTPDLEYDHELETIGTLHLLHACAAAGVGRIVVQSSTMLYGPRPDNPNYLDESHPLHGHPSAHCVANRVEAEGLVADWSRRHPEADVSVLRTCWVLGPTYNDSVVRYFDRNTVPIVLGYDPLLQFVHEDDALRAFETAVVSGRPGVWNIVGSGVLPLVTLLRVAGKRPLPLPASLLSRLGALPSWQTTGDPPEAFFDYLRFLWVGAGERGFAAFGEPRYTTREAWMSLVSSRRMRRYR